MTSVFKITDGTTTVDFIGGPFYLFNWRPAIAKYKGDGVFLDSPLSTGRTLAHRIFGNATERIDLKLRAINDDDAARQTNRLLTLAEQAAEHSTTGGIFDPVWLEVKSKNETNTRYAVVVKAELVDLENPFNQPFRQGDCSAVMDNLVFVVEHREWVGAPPGELSSIQVTEGVVPLNLITHGSFERWPANTSQHDSTWTSFNSPTTEIVTREQAYEGVKSLKLVGTSSLDRGVYQDVVANDGLVSGASYTVTARCLVEDGAASLIAYDSGGFSNAVRDDTSSRKDELIVNKTFETNLSGWGAVLSRGFTAARSNTYAYDATTWSLKLDWSIVRRTDRHYYSADIVALPAFATNLAVGFAGLRTSSGGSVFARITFLDDNQNYVSATDLFPIEMSGTAEWHYYTFDAVVPDDAAYFQFYFFAYMADISIDLGNSFTYYFDEVTVTATLPSIATTTSSEWQLLSVTKTASPGIRVALATETTLGGTVFFDDVTLEIDYAPDGSEDSEAFVANSSMWYNITHVFTYDDPAVYSSNLLASTLPYNLFPQTPATSDAIYFGTRTGPFSNVAFDLSGIIDASTLSVTWEYYNNSGGDGWDPLSVRDKTEGFTKTGKNVVSWYVPEDWLRTTVNSISSAYWVRAVLTVASPQSTAVQKTTHPHVINRAYFEVDSEQVSGHMRALMKYRLTNESGPQTIGVTELITAGADDVFASGGSLTSGDSTVDMSSTDSIGLRFQSLAIPQGARILNARLYCKPTSASPSGESKYLNFWVWGHDNDDSPAWSTYSDFVSRVTNNSTPVATEGTFETLEVIERANEKYLGFSRLERIIEYIVGRDGWVSGNDLSLFIVPPPVPLPAILADYIRFSMYDGDSESWILEVEYMSEARYTSSIHMGARSVSRGSDFQAHLEATGADITPAGVDIELGVGAAHTFDISYAGSYIPMGRGFVLTGTHIDEGWWDRVTWVLSPPLSQQYEGRFRAFAKVALSTVAGESVRFRLRTQIGSGGSKFTGDASLMSASDEAYFEGNYPHVVDLGPVTIPKLGGADSLRFALQSLTSDELAIYIFSFILIPIDEWYVEAVQPADSSISLDNDTYVEINSADATPDLIRTTINDKRSTAVRNNMVISGSPATLAASRTQRVWMLTSSVLSPTGSRLELPSRGTHNDIVHKISAKAVLRYLGMRGDA
jgi:hypothetical protein